MLKIILASLLFISTIYADEFKGLTPNQIEKILNNEIPPLADDPFQEVDSLSEFLDSTIKRPKALAPPKFKVAPTPPAPYRAVFKKDSILYDQVKEKYFKSEKSYYVWARELIEGGKYSYILDKNKKKQFVTLTKNLKSFENDIFLYPNVDATISYKKERNYSAYDKEQDLKFELSYGIEAYNNQYIADVSDLETSTATSNNLSLNALLKISNEFYFGLTTSFKSGSYQTAATWKEFTAGPKLSYQLSKSTNTTWETFLFAQKSLFHQLNNTETSLSFSQISWGAGLQLSYLTDLGKVLFGTNLSQNKASGQASESETSSNRDNSFDTSISIFMGYQWDIKL